MKIIDALSTAFSYLFAAIASAMRLTRNDKKLVCPSCGQRTGREILYGLPVGGRMKPGRIYGGCRIKYGKSEMYGCLACDHKWGLYEDLSGGFVCSVRGDGSGGHSIIRDRK